MDSEAGTSSQRPFTERLAAARRAGREFADADGFWYVYELPPTEYDRRTSPSLVFEGDGAFHCVRNFPPDWRQLDLAALRALRERR